MFLKYGIELSSESKMTPKSFVEGEVWTFMVGRLFICCNNAPPPSIFDLGSPFIDRNSGPSL